MSVSPTLLARSYAYEIAGRGGARRRAFEEQTAAYHTYLQALFVPRLMRRATSAEVVLPKTFAFEEASKTTPEKERAIR